MNKKCLGCMEKYSSEFSVCPNCGYIEGTEVEEAVHMEPGTSLADRYIIGKVLGYGGFGVTYIAWDKLLEQKVAIKEYLPSEFSTRMPGDPTVTVFSGDRSEQFTEGLDKFVEEAKRLSKFQNEAGIVKIFDSFKANNTAYIVMEYLDGETLTTYMEREGVIPEDKAVEMLAPVMISLQAVHEEGILHRDIAPDNIFLTKSGEVKLIDFGASRYATTSHSRSLTVIIKPGYSPEEQYRSRGDQGPHTDVYALAAVMYKMITGITPPDALERRALIETKKKELLKDIHKTNKNISPNIENAILNAMNVQVEDRTADIISFMGELSSTTPVKRRYGKIKKIDVYAWPLWVKIVIPAVVVASLVTGILLATGVIDFPSLFSGEVVVPEGMVIVPDVEGMNADEALAEINNVGLTPSPEGNIESDYVEAGKIVIQSPAGGMYLAKYEEVFLTVSSGSGVVGPVNGISTVPYVVWDTEEDALTKLEKAGLAKPIIEAEYDENVPKGQVISQSVSTGTKVNEGTQITLVVSKGPTPFEMPNVVGKTKQVAESELTAKGLAVYFEYVTDDSVAENTVLGQSAAAGTMVQKGNKIALKISSKSATVVVGNVVGKSQSEATSTLKNQGFAVTVLENYDDTVAKGNVISQTPASGTSHIKGSNVTIVVSKGVPNVTVPNVVGQTEANATSTLKSAGFTVTTSTAYSDTVAEGNVINQSVKAGEQVSKDTQINIIVSLGKGNNTSESFFSTTVTNNEATITDFAEDYSGHVVIPQYVNGYPVTGIGNSAFISHQNITSVTIPDSVTSIGDKAFYNCDSLKSVNIPNSVTSIDANAFRDCAMLTSITIPSSVTSIGHAAFIHCPLLTGIWVDKENREYCSDEKGVLFNKNKTIIYQAPGSISGTYTIPNSVSTMDSGVFAGCSKLTSVTIPNGITSISDSAFYSCYSLKSVNIPSGVTSIEAFAFFNCEFKSVTIPDGVVTIGDAAFQSCSSLTSINIPDSVTSIGPYTFVRCSNIKTVYFQSEAQKEKLKKYFNSNVNLVVQ